MIVKSYEISKLKLDRKFFLIYGKNEGLKTELIKKLLKGKKGISTYEEKEILENSDRFIENILTKSLFENEKIILIKRGTDKILKIIEELNKKNIQDVIIIINSESLEKKSKLRSHFEKDKKNICIAVYPDDEKTLSKLIVFFLQEKKISISQENINLIINKCNGDRNTLRNELEKIEFLKKSRDNITTEDISKLTNLVENHNISELIDNCLAKNKKKTIVMLNENNFSSDDSIIILKTLLYKAKKILVLCGEYEMNQNMNLTISSAKPPIFWKDKEITKKQISNWTSKNVKKMIYNLSDLELLIKKNFDNSIKLITDFIIEQSSLNSNN